jgi:CRP/FNR family transcriptional regulator, cyclic AMP receptor protein
MNLTPNADPPKIDTQRTSNLEPIETLIRQHPFLRDLTSHHYQILSRNAIQWHFRAGENIFRQGDTANRFYLIRRGKVAVEAWSRERGDTEVQILAAGDVLGWSWLFEPYVWQFRARALEPTDAILIHAAPLRAECEADHDLGYELMKRAARLMMQRLQATRRQLVALPHHGRTPILEQK